MLSLDIKTQAGGHPIAVKVNVERGVTALFGPSGSGKTTLLRAIAGLMPCEGSITFGEEVWQNADYHKPSHMRQVGYVFQEDRLFPHLSVEQNLGYGLERADALGTPTRLSMQDVVTKFNLQNLLTRRPVTLSGGESRRVNIARAILAQPRLLLLDEPLTGLDGARKAEIIPYLASIARELEIPIIYVSHINDEIAKLCGHMLIMQQGTVVDAGRTQDVLPRLGETQAHSVGELSEAGSLVSAKVDGFDSVYSMTSLRLAGQSLQVVGLEPPATAEVRVFLAARDIAIATQRPTHISIRNMLATKVTSISVLSGLSQGLVAVDLVLDGGDEKISAHISQAACDALGLTTGAHVFALIKSAKIAPPT